MLSFPHSQDTFHYPIVARTTAKVARNCLADFVLGRVWIAIQKGFGRYNHSRSAETALNRPLLDKLLLKRMQFPIFRYPLNSHDF